MKNDKNSLAQKGREVIASKAATTDILVNPNVVRDNKTRLGAQPRRRRRTNYAKKIMNDPFIFNV